MNLKSNVIIHRPVSNFKHICKVLNNNIEVLFFGGAHDSIIDANADNEVNKISGSRFVVDTCICITSDEIVKLEKSIKDVDPQSARLFSKQRWERVFLLRKPSS